MQKFKNSTKNLVWGHLIQNSHGVNSKFLLALLETENVQIVGINVAGHFQQKKRRGGVHNN